MEGDSTPADFSGELTKSIRASKQQKKIVKENIDNVEQYYPQLIHDINLYTVRSAKLRDAGDKFSQSLHRYAASESPALKSGLDVVADCFKSIQDHREALVTRLENKVVIPFSVYETRCEQVKVDAEQPILAQRREKIQHRSFERIRNKSPQHPRYVKAEAKYRRASDEVNRSRQILRDQVSDFEREKIRDLKQVFGDFLLSEMLFFSKSLELYTHAYQRLTEVDEEEVVEQLDDSMSGVASYGAISDTSSSAAVDEAISTSNPRRVAQD